MSRDVTKTFSTTSGAFVNVLKAANKLVPGAIVVAGLVASVAIAAISTSTSAMAAAVTIGVVFTSLLVFAATRNYGEASLALVAGLLTVLTVDWTVGRFLVFSTAWLAFSFLALILSSLRLASQSEDIYLQAALSVEVEGDTSALVKQLKGVGKLSDRGILGPIERAEVIRVLALRRVPIEVMKATVDNVEMISTITRMDHKAVALFLSDVLHAAARSSGAELPTVDSMYGIIKSTAVEPEDFFAAFRESRYRVLSGEMPVLILLERIRSGLERGLSPGDIDEFVATGA